MGSSKCAEELHRYRERLEHDRRWFGLIGQWLFGDEEFTLHWDETEWFNPAKDKTMTNDIYGNCPICGAPGVTRERRPNGNDRCEGGHEYASADAITGDTKEPPTHCETCRFWKLRYPEGREGECHWRPPVGAGPWPTTYDVDWCGEYKAGAGGKTPDNTIIECFPPGMTEVIGFAARDIKVGEQIAITRYPDRLESCAIDFRLPDTETPSNVTADGVRVYVGDVVWEPMPCGPRPYQVRTFDGLCFDAVRDDGVNGCERAEVSECYSTEERADAAERYGVEWTQTAKGKPVE